MRVCTALATLVLVAGFNAWADPESLQGRHAVRGTPVELPQVPEEIRAMQEFDQSLTREESAGAGQVNLQDPTRPWLAELKMPRETPMRLDARVLRYLDFYKTDKRGRSIIASWLKRMPRYHGLIHAALQRSKLPLGLEYVAMIESGFDPHVRSGPGAVGIWQFMPEGAKIYGLRVDYWIDERMSPERSTDAVLRYFADLESRFGSWALALAAFNAGYGAVLRAMQKYNTNDYWELCRHEDGLPWDTVLYVPKMMAVAIVAENRELFGFGDLPLDPEQKFDRVTVPGSMSLAAAARAAGVQQNDLTALNPELKRNRTPPEKWALRLPRGSAGRFVAQLAKEREAVQPVVVKFGERLEEIAARYGLQLKALKAMNGIENAFEVRAGLTLIVPEGKPRTLNAPCETVIVAVPNKEALVPGRKRVFYRTLPLDTVAEIAAAFKVSPGDLAKWNSVDPTAKLASNMVVQAWVPNEFDGAQVALLDPANVRIVTRGSQEFFDLIEAKKGRKRLSYQVKHGENLKQIGKKFGLTVGDLERINQFSSAHAEVKPGQKLTIYVPMTAAEKVKAACALTPSGLDPTGQQADKSDKELEEDEDAPQSAAPSLPKPPPVDGRP